MDGSATFTTTASSVTMKKPSTAAVSARPAPAASRARPPARPLAAMSTDIRKFLLEFHRRGTSDGIFR